jgi:predicted glutamine amidotransferase
MCRMLAVLARDAFPIARYLWGEAGSLRSLATWGKECPHQDGAGILYRDPAGALVRKRWGQDRFGEFLAAGEGDLVKAESTFLLGHARKASDMARLSEDHAHPLEREGIFLAHNGTIRDAAKLGVPGDIDSQQLLGWLAKEWRPRDQDGLRRALEKLLATVSDYSAIDLLLVAGGDLYVFCRFADPGKADYYTLRWRVEPDRLVVASEPLDEGDGWRAMENGELLRVTAALTVSSAQVH